jgi:hypothetical protein
MKGKKSGLTFSSVYSIKQWQYSFLSFWFKI